MIIMISLSNPWTWEQLGYVQKCCYVLMAVGQLGARDGEVLVDLPLIFPQFLQFSLPLSLVSLSIFGSLISHVCFVSVH